MRLPLALAAMLLASIEVAPPSAAVAAEALPPRPFAFSTMDDPSKVKCIQINVSALKCERVNLEVGHAQQCTSSNKKQVFLVFPNKAGCEAERQGEMTND